MKVFLNIFLALMALLCGTAQANAIDSSTRSEVNYAVKKGDTLTAIAVKFSGNTVRDIAKKNAIANPNLIHPGMVLRVTQTTSIQTQAAVIRKQVNIEQHTNVRMHGRAVRMAKCDIAPIVSRLKYPTSVGEQFSKMLTVQADAKKAFPWGGAVVDNGVVYQLLLEDRCVASKTVDPLQNVLPKIAQTHVPRTDDNTAALTPRQIVEKIATTHTVQAKPGELTDTELAEFLVRIRTELQEIMGKDEDVTPLVLPLAHAILGGNRTATR